MFNPSFSKFRRKRIKPAKITEATNCITNFFPSLPEKLEKQLANNNDNSGRSNGEVQGDLSSSQPCSSKERLSQFTRKRRSTSQPRSSAKESKKNSSIESDMNKSSTSEKDAKLTPFEKQVMELKSKHKGMLLMIQSGYKYFFYGDDAEIASKVLNIGLFPYNNFVRSSVPMERLHFHAQRLIEAGHKVGIVKQQEVAELKAIGDNKNKVFDRELTAVYSKATAIGEDINPINQSFNKDSEESSTRFILSVSELQDTHSKVKLGLVAFDVGTGEAYYDFFEDGSKREELDKRLEHICPAEILISEKISISTKVLLKHCKGRIEVLSCEKFDFSPALLVVAAFLSSGKSCIDDITSMPPAIVCALSALICYLKDFSIDQTLKPENLQSFSCGELYVNLDGSTMRNLEIFQTLDGNYHGSLFWLFSHHAHSHFGSRVLREWLSRPIRDIETLHQRQDAIAELLKFPKHSVMELHAVLQKMPDLEHGLTSVLIGRSTPSSLFTILQNLQCLKVRLQDIIGASDVCISSPLLNKLVSESAFLLSNIPQFLANLNEKAARGGDVTNFLNDYSNFPGVIQLQHEINEVSEQLESLLPSIARILGLKNIKYTTVHGLDYLIEVKINKNVPLNWMKVSETKHLSRYHTPEVVKLRSELSILKAQLKQECQNSWNEYINCFNKFYSDHKKAVKNISTLDALIALSQLARSGEYCRPDLVEDDIVINIEKGSHPVVAKMMDHFVPNNTHLESPENICMVLSGPNMGGKSCYIKQTALIACMALTGSYVPAESATIGLLDGIYTRIGARDEIFEGRSTLMLEMEECSSILSKATRRSLVLMDELGRGTSSHDGAAIAVSTLTYLLNEVQCLSLFVTHYPSVMDVTPNYNFHMGFSLHNFGSSEVLTLLYVVCSGKADRSFGLNVCRLAGIPLDIADKASSIAELLQNADELKRIAIDVAREEWENVATIETTYSIQTFQSQPEFIPHHITYQEALEYFACLDMSEHMGNIQVEVQRRGLCTLLSCIMGPPQLETNLTEERTFVFAIAQCQLDVSQAIHVKILQTVYYRLTGASVSCPCFGSHWEHIGFQGSDPGTDLRGAGMLGLLQLLYLCTTPQLSSLAKRIYRLSIDVVQNFPLAILSFNFTRMALQALRHGQLNSAK